MTSNPEDPYIEDVGGIVEIKDGQKYNRSHSPATGRFSSGGGMGRTAAPPIPGMGGGYPVMKNRGSQASGGGHTVEAFDPNTRKNVTLKSVGRPVPASSVRVDHTSYIAAHGKNPRSTPGASAGTTWAFSFGNRNSPYKMYRGNLTQASGAARKDAGLLGHYSIHTQG